MNCTINFNGSVEVRASELQVGEKLQAEPLATMDAVGDQALS